MEQDISGIRWKIGWNPALAIIGTTVILAIVGVAIDAIVPFIAIGLLAGIAVWYWGVGEINSKYSPIKERFYDETARAAARGIDMDNADSFSLNFAVGDSPPLIEAAPKYKSTAILVSDTSFNVNQGAVLDMKQRSKAEGGTNKEFFYDQVSSVETHQSGGATYLEVRTSDGNSVELGPSVQESVAEAEAAIRKQMRETKRSSA